MPPLEGKQGYDTYARNTLDKIHHDKKKTQQIKNKEA